MTVGLSLGTITDEVGTSEFFHAFFSTISGNLEPRGWGSRFPVLMDGLYQGELPQAKAEAALVELRETRQELSGLDPINVIWDIEDRSKQPPWGVNVSKDITHLGNYFVTSTGRDLFEVMFEIIEELRDQGGTIRVVTY